jgi:hypothetical protein
LLDDDLLLFYNTGSRKELTSRLGWLMNCAVVLKCSDLFTYNCIYVTYYLVIVGTVWNPHVGFYY